MKVISVGQPVIPQTGFLRSFSFAAQGVWHVVRTQRNMRVHLAAALAAIIAGLVLRIGAADWAAVLAVIGLVLTAETLNTVVEALVDLGTSEFHPLAKAATWTWRSGTASTPAGGSTIARTTCTGGWPSSTWAISAPARTTTTGPRPARCVHDAVLANAGRATP
jgi:diacylglycerol kinase